MNDKEFSLEQSEELIANLKSGAHSDFEQLRSTLNLLAHVPEISPVATPPILPSAVALPAPVVPIRSRKPQRTIITSIVTIGLFASVSLAAAAVTGIGPAPIVNVGHQTAKFVKSFVGAVSHVITGADPAVAIAESSGTPAPATTLPPAQTQATSNGNSDQANSENSSTIISPVLSIVPLAPSGEKSDNNSHQSESPKPVSTHNSQSPKPQDSPTPKFSPPQIPTGQSDDSSNENQVATKPSALPTSIPSSLPTAGTGQENENNAQPTIQPTPAATPSGVPQPPLQSSDGSNSDD